MTLYELMDSLEESLKLTPEQKFRVAAQIKRYVHFEKYSLLSRLDRHFIDPNGELASKKFIKIVLEEKISTHEQFMNLPDEEVLTFDMGNFKYYSRENK